MKKLLFLLLNLILLSGCTSLLEDNPFYLSPKIYNQRKAEKLANYLSQNPDISEFRKNAIINEKIILGLTQADVEYIIGYPKDKNKTVGPWGTDEQWIYSNYQPGDSDYYAKYYYFENGILTNYQK